MLVFPDTRQQLMKLSSGFTWFDGIESTIENIEDKLSNPSVHLLQEDTKITHTSPVSSEWFERCYYKHSLVMVFITLAAALILPISPQMSSTTELIVLTVAVSIFGVPHGAFDWFLGQAILRPIYRTRWTAIFVPAYVSMMAIVLLLWASHSGIALLFFFFISMIHFGVGDMPSRLQLQHDKLFLFSDIICRGLLPIMCPLFFQTEEVSDHVTWLLSYSNETAMENVYDVLRNAGMWGMICFSITGVISVIGDVLLSRKFPELSRTLFVSKTSEIIVLPLLFYRVKSVSLTFMIYFCFWHSIRHIFLLGTLFQENSITMKPKSIMRNSKKVFMISLPVTIATIVLGYIFYTNQVYRSVQAVTSGVNPGVVVQVLFIGLSALTLPHMIVTELYQRIPAV